MPEAKGRRSLSPWTGKTCPRWSRHRDWPLVSISETRLTPRSRRGAGRSAGGMRRHRSRSRHRGSAPADLPEPGGFDGSSAVRRPEDQPLEDGSVITVAPPGEFLGCLFLVVTHVVASLPFRSRTGPSTRQRRFDRDPGNCESLPKDGDFRNPESTQIIPHAYLSGCVRRPAADAGLSSTPEGRPVSHDETRKSLQTRDRCAIEIDCGCRF